MFPGWFVPTDCHVGLKSYMNTFQNHMMSAFLDEAELDNPDLSFANATFLTGYHTSTFL